MYLYLGGDTALETGQIVGIFDLDNASWSYLTRGYLSGAEKRGQVKNLAEDIPKSFVVCADEKVLLTQPNTSVLVRRLDSQERVNV